MSDEHLITENPRIKDSICVERFSEKMNAKLFKNRFKAHWSTVPQSYLLERLKEELVELEEALREGVGIESECADVANFAMMIADNAEYGETK